MNGEIMVSVLCTVYNHAPYLRKAIDSLIEQETEYSFEILINDDASTDGSTDIIKEYEQKYPELIRAVYHSENQYSKGIRASVFLRPIARGKYIAICEGDDFWIDKKKLQTQISFMEKNQDYSLCAHAAYYSNENNNLLRGKYSRPYTEDTTVILEDVINKWLFATNSLVYRSDICPAIIPFQGDCYNGDYALTVYLALVGKVFYFDKFMSAYRIRSRGSINWIWSHDRNRYFDAQMKLVDMVKRIDAFTNGNFHSLLSEKADSILFKTYIQTGNIEEAKKNISKYKTLSLPKKIRLYAEHYMPGVMNALRRIKRG